MGYSRYYYLRKNFINSAKRTVYFDFQTYLYERLGKVSTRVLRYTVGRLRGSPHGRWPMRAAYV